MPCELKFKEQPNDVAKVRKLFDCQKQYQYNPNAETTEIHWPNKKIKLEPDVISVEDTVINNSHLIDY